MKTAISMPDELYQAVIAYAGGKKFSTTVCELVRKGLNPDQPKVQPEYNHSMNVVHPKVIPDEWLQRFENIENRLNLLEQREVIPKVVPEIVPEVTLTSSPVNKVQPEIIPEIIPEVVPEVVPTPEKYVALMMAPTDPDEKIRVTPASKKQIIERVDLLKKSGLAVKDIAEKAGINFNSMRKLVNPNFNKSQNITRREFSALMNIKPGDDCETQEPGANQS